MGHRSRAALAGVVAACAVASSGCAPEQPWRSELVSVNAAGTGGGNGPSGIARFSPDGTRVVFESDASDLGPTDTNGLRDLYLRDLTTGTTQLVSANAAGTDGGNGPTHGDNAVFSPDGTKIAFTSSATDLGPHDSDPSGADGGEVDVYVRDLVTSTTTMVSVNEAGTDSGNGPSSNSGFSPDGGTLAFGSSATDLGPTDTNGAYDAYLHDLATGTTTLAVPDASGTDSPEFGVGGIGFSPDGTHVAFVSVARDLGAPYSPNGMANVYLRNLATGEVTLLSATPGGTGAGGSMFYPLFSPDGGRVAMSGFAGDLGPTDTNGQYDLYVRDLASGTVSLVSVNAAGTDAGNGDSANSYPSFSPDGNRIAFESTASDLGPTDTNTCVRVPPRPPSPPRSEPCPDVYVRDLVTGTTTLVSANAAGTDSGNDLSERPQFSPDGTKILFESLASNLGPADSNRTTDIYVRDLTTGTTTLVSARADGAEAGNGTSRQAVFGPDGTTVAYTSSAADLGPADDGGQDVYLARLHAADLAVTLDARPEPVRPGGRIAYGLAVTNGGPDDAENATAALLLPGGTSFVDASTGCRRPTRDQPRLVVCRLGDMAPDTTADLTVTARVGRSPGATLTAVAAADARTADPDGGDNAATLTSTVAPPGAP